MWQYLILIFFSTQVLASAIDVAIVERHKVTDPSHHTGAASEAFRTEMETVGLDIVQLTLAFTIIYMLVVF